MVRDYRALVRQTRMASYAALVVATLIALVGITSMFATRRNATWLAHSQEVRGVVRDVVFQMTEAAEAERSYLITGDAEYIAEFDTAVSRARSGVLRFAMLTADNPRQIARAARLRQLLEHRIALLSHEITVARTASRERAMRGVSPERDAATDEPVIAVARGALDEERALLVERRARLDEHIWRAAFVIAIGFLATFATIWMVNTRLLRAIRARERAEQAAVEAREQAEAANRAKSDFLARMSHELRTPLNSVIGFANVLLKNRNGQLSPTDITYLGRIQANGRHLLSLINQILDLAKIESGHMDVSIEPVDLVALARDVVQQFEPQLRDRPVTVAAEVPPDLGPVNTDPGKLRQILINLVGNAAKFTERGSITVVVTATPGGDPRTIEVRDTGIGIPEDRLAAVFDAFEQADTGTARRFGGTGLGLSISRSLAELLGLSLTVKSRVGEGTMFTLAFPAHQAVPTPPRGAPLYQTADWPAATEESRAARGRTVLVVDDDADARMLLARYIEDMGARVLAAADGDHGVTLAVRERPDVILLDIRMAGMDGEQVAHRLAADPASAGIPVIIASVVANEYRGKLPGVAAFVEKPFTRAALAGALDQALGAAPAR